MFTRNRMYCGGFMKSTILIYFLTSLLILAQQEAVTKDGKRVLLNNDGTWQYAAETAVNKNSTISIPEKRNFNHPIFSEDPNSLFQFEIKYDKEKDNSTVSLNIKLSQIVEDLTIGSFFSYGGKNLITPATVSLRFVSRSEDWNYLRNSELVFFVDGRRIDLGQMKRSSSVRTGYVLEFLSITIPLNTFLEIFNGKAVEAKLFTTTFKFTEEQLEAFRDYASRMQ